MHTQGEWKVRTDSYNWDILAVNGKSREQVCTLTGRLGQNEANARLIAAAPAMFEALKELTYFLYGYSESPEHVPSKEYARFKEKYNKGFAALAQAEGKEV